ncbi:MAG: hypothetical protein KKB79_01575 [Nanoarchaeota archaeon]|nr:hypothetical protein [Nanoarchaeota archaeon]
MNLYYDDEGDFLEMSVGNTSNCFFDNLGDGIFKIVDKQTGETKGIAIHNFRSQTKTEEVNLKLPFSFKFE